MTQPQTTCHCLACDPKSGEIGLAHTVPNEVRWTTELLQRKLQALLRANALFIAQLSPDNGDYSLDCMKEYANVWCEHKAR